MDVFGLSFSLGLQADFSPEAPSQADVFAESETPADPLLANC